MARRIQAILFIATLMVVGCGSDRNSTGRVVNVYNWADYIAPELVARFETETGITVNYDTFDSNEILETKLLTGGAGYDVVVPSANFLQRQIAAGVFRRLNRELLPNLGNLDSELMDLLASHDPNNEHAAGYMWGTTGIGFNAARLAEISAALPTDSWRVVYDPIYAEQLGRCGLAFVDAPSEVFATVLMYLGKEPDSTQPEDMQAVEATLMAIRPYVRYINSVPLIEDLANGSVCAAVAWSGDVAQSRIRAGEAGLELELHYVIPIEGTISWFDTLAIPADAKNVEAAHAFIDFLLQPDVAATNVNYISYASFNEAALPLIDPAITSDPSIYPAPEVQARLRAAKARSQEQTRVENRIWTRFRTGQ